MWCEFKNGDRKQSSAVSMRDTSCSSVRRATRKGISRVTANASNPEKLQLVGECMPFPPRSGRNRAKCAQRNFGDRRSSECLHKQRIPLNTPDCDFFNEVMCGKDRSSKSAIPVAKLPNFDISVRHLLSYNVHKESRNTKPTHSERSQNLRDKREAEKKNSDNSQRHRKKSRAKKQSLPGLGGVAMRWPWKPETRKRTGNKKAKLLPNLRYFKKSEKEEVDVKEPVSQLDGVLKCTRVRSGVPVYIDTQKIVEEIINGEGLDDDDGDDHNDNEEDEVESFLEEAMVPFGEGCRVLMLKSTQGSIEEVVELRTPELQKNKREPKRSFSNSREADVLDTREEENKSRNGAPKMPRDRPTAVVRPVTLKLSSRDTKHSYVPRLPARQSRSPDMPSVHDASSSFLSMVCLKKIFPSAKLELY